MADQTKLDVAIADALSLHVKAQNLPSVCVGLGLASGEADEAFQSKRSYVAKRLATLAPEVLAQLGRTVLAKHQTFELEEAVAVLDPDNESISELTRRNVVRELGQVTQFSGSLGLLDFLGRVWPVASMMLSGYGFGTVSAQDVIEQHAVRKEDISTEDLLGVLGVLRCSQQRFVRLLELATHPLVRQGDEQAGLAAALTGHLRRDGYELVPTEQLSGFPVYTLLRVRHGVPGRPRNLIFAAIGPKPQIVLSDAINNDISIVENAGGCLVYDRPIGHTGLRWRELVDWWADLEGVAPDSRGASVGLYRRLYTSLASPPEQALFKSYYRLGKAEGGDRLPALVPQVYLHYDPYTVRQLGGVTRLSRQRMDFLLLLSQVERVVIEVDGKQHYADGDRASPSRYSEMVAADRELRLAGYDVYRFGGHELMRPDAADVVMKFFRQLLRKHLA